MGGGGKVRKLCELKFLLEPVYILVMNWLQIQFYFERSASVWARFVQEHNINDYFHAARRKYDVCNT